MNVDNVGVSAGPGWRTAEQLASELGRTPKFVASVLEDRCSYFVNNIFTITFTLGQ